MPKFYLIPFGGRKESCTQSIVLPNSKEPLQRLVFLLMTKGHKVRHINMAGLPTATLTICK